MSQDLVNESSPLLYPHHSKVISDEDVMDEDMVPLATHLSEYSLGVFSEAASSISLRTLYDGSSSSSSNNNKQQDDETYHSSTDSSHDVEDGLRGAYFIGGEAYQQQQQQEEVLSYHDENTPLTKRTSSSFELEDPIGFVIISFIVLLGDSCRGVLFPILWPLVEKLGGDLVVQGYTVAAFSCGRAFAAPYFGTKNVNSGCYRPVLKTALSTMIIGAIMLMQVQSFETYGLYCLIASQFVLGIGSGTLGVTRGYVAHVTTKSQRTRYIAFLTALQYAGFTVMPFVGSFFTSHFSGTANGIIALDEYTCPAIFIGALALIAILLLDHCFEDYLFEPTIRSTQKQNIEISTQKESQSLLLGFSKVDLACLGCLLLNVTTKGSISCMETLGIDVAANFFHISPQSAGDVVATNGSLGVFVLFFYGFVSSYFCDIYVVAAGICTMAFGILILIYAKFSVITTFAYQMYASAIFLLYTLGYPIGHTAAMGLFSKLSKSNAQGAVFGWFATAGSMARMVFPVIAGYVAQEGGDLVLFCLLIPLLVGSMTILLRYRQALLELLA